MQHLMHADAACDAAQKDIIVTRGDAKIYHSSEKGLRKFCGRCGTQVFFQTRGKLLGYLILHGMAVVFCPFRLLQDMCLARLLFLPRRSAHVCEGQVVTGKRLPGAGNVSSAPLVRITKLCSGFSAYLRPACDQPGVAGRNVICYGLI